MAFEIERKFLLVDDSWRTHIRLSLSIQQAYLCNTDKASLRVRISGEQGYISSKSMTTDIRRHEFEYPIPLHDAEFMLLNMCMGSPILKTRHYIDIDRHTWEIDEFHGDNSGLIVAEIELGHEQETFVKPGWLGQEVSTDPRFFNMALAENPFCNW